VLPCASSRKALNLTTWCAGCDTRRDSVCVPSAAVVTATHSAVCQIPRTAARYRVCMTPDRTMGHARHTRMRIHRSERQVALRITHVRQKGGNDREAIKVTHRILRLWISRSQGTLPALNRKRILAGHPRYGKSLPEQGALDPTRREGTYESQSSD